MTNKLMRKDYEWRLNSVRNKICELENYDTELRSSWKNFSKGKPLNQGIVMAAIGVAYEEDIFEKYWEIEQALKPLRQKESTLLNKMRTSQGRGASL